jgi:two-component system response regulator HydG
VHPLSILVVDDEAYVRETLAEFATILAHRVVKAEGGRAAMAAATAEAFDLVLLDLSMPKMNGWETAREIRRIQPKTRIVLTTGYGHDAPAMAGHDPKLVDKIIAKPFTFNQIAELITQMNVSTLPSVGSKEVQQKAG